jgi:hypothetical protein
MKTILLYVISAVLILTQARRDPLLSGQQEHPNDDSDFTLMWYR